MRSIPIIVLFCLISGLQVANAQSYFDGKFRIAGYTHKGYNYTLYDFSREGGKIKAKYFAQNAYTQYQNWKSGKQVLLITAGAFSDSWNQDGKPVGLCVDNGAIVNRVPNSDMDGMVIVYNGGAQQGGLAVVDMDIKPVTVQNPTGSYYPRTSAEDRTNFLSWGETNGVTLFQTQLVYSSDRSSSNANLTYGSKRERRFLAICRKNNVVHHVVVNAPDDLELNLSASYAKAVLDYDGFSVLFIMNLDTGDKNVLHAYDGSYLKDMKPYKGSSTYADRAKVENATNLLIYYTE
ncbi:hypothetical protein OCK74_19975 [Chitinophagaceae bacterium LB-8]|uniref:Phosphodiester glycosidase domain-containing protein n=1 Tax=Paraflavisolibacter caeni TaxID=2982496 RepID=A0A9X2XXV9_9BACT|nr:hypothetical protein [Paraflavisolibacter caeni]MCU7551411.1 hypothetical protein [Paraflavisolibacter caeni]